MGAAFPENNSLADILMLAFGKIREKIEGKVWKITPEEMSLVDKIEFESLILDVKKEYGSGFAKLYRDMPEGVLVYVEYMESAPSGNPTLSKPRKYAGIGAALLAFGIQLSIDYGYGGAIYLKAKTSQLREHYMRNYGAIPFSRFDPFLLLIDGDAARELFGQYLKEV